MGVVIDVTFVIIVVVAFTDAKVGLYTIWGLLLMLLLLLMLSLLQSFVSVRFGGGGEGGGRGCY